MCKKTANGQNIFVHASAALDSGDVHADVKADGFNISRLVRAPKRTEMTDSIFAMNFSLDATADYNIKSGALSYSSKGDVFVPSGAIPVKEFADDILVSYSFSGDDKKIEVPYFRTSGERYNLSFDAHMVPVLGVYYGGLEQIHGNSHGGEHAEGKDQREAPYGILLFGTLFFFSRHRSVGF